MFERRHRFESRIKDHTDLFKKMINKSKLYSQKEEEERWIKITYKTYMEYLKEELKAWSSIVLSEGACLIVLCLF